MDHGKNPTDSPQAPFPVTMLTQCRNCGGNIATDTCGHGSHPIYSSVYNFGGINVTTTAPVYQWFGPSNNQGNTQFEGHTMGPDMENVHPYSDNGQVNYPYDPQPNAAYPLSSTNSSEWPTVRRVGSDAITIASQNRRKTEPRFRCSFEDCNKTFTAKHNLDSHERAHLDIRPFQCVCGSKFTANADLKRHWKSLKHADESQVTLLSN